MCQKQCRTNQDKSDLIRKYVHRSLILLFYDSHCLIFHLCNELTHFQKYYPKTPNVFFLSLIFKPNLSLSLEITIKFLVFFPIDNKYI